MYEEIKTWITSLLAEHGYEDTPQNRLDAMRGLMSAWEEDVENDPALAEIKRAYVNTLSLLITLAKAEVQMASVLTPSTPQSTEQE